MNEFNVGDRVELTCPCHKGVTGVVIRESVVTQFVEVNCGETELGIVHKSMLKKVERPCYMSM